MKFRDVLRKGVRYITNPGYRLEINSRYFGCYHEMKDEEYLKRIFLYKMGYELDLNCPTTFNEKLQWLKIHDRHPEYTTMVDKYAVKDYVTKRIGAEYVIPTLGVWNHFEEINFDKLPNQFVLKCTHDSGGLVICLDKSTLDKKAAKKKLERCLKRNYYYSSREWPYKDVHPRLIAEKYIEDSATDGLLDYKFYCFHGEPRFLYVSEGLGGDHSLAKMNFVNLEWKITPFQRPDFMEFEEMPAKPAGFDKMIELSAVLSQGIPFLRVDWYSVNQQVYFSELTFSPGGGFTPFSPYEWERKIGDWIRI